MYRQSKCQLPMICKQQSTTLVYILTSSAQKVVHHGYSDSALLNSDQNFVQTEEYMSVDVNLGSCQIV